MDYIFTGLAVVNSLLLLLVAATGWLARTGSVSSSMHVQAGLFGTLFTCLVHSIIFVYFLGTGKSIKTACEEHGIRDDFTRSTRRLKGQAFPFALFGALAIMGVAIAGGGVNSGVIQPSIHLYLALSVFAWNIMCFFFEYKAVRTNMNLLTKLAEALPSG